jgi:transposase
MQELARIVEAGPDPQIDGVVRWRQIDLVRIIKEPFGVVCSDSAVANYQSELGFSYISARPQHPAQDPKIIDGFKKTSPEHSLRPPVRHGTSSSASHKQSRQSV